MAAREPYIIDNAILENTLYQMHCYWKATDIDSAINYFDDNFILNIYDCFKSYVRAIQPDHLRDVLEINAEDTDLYFADPWANQYRKHVIEFARILYHIARKNVTAPSAKSRKASKERAHAPHIFWAEETALVERIVQLVDELVRKGHSYKAAAMNLARNSNVRLKRVLTEDQILNGYRKAKKTK